MQTSNEDLEKALYKLHYLSEESGLTKRTKNALKSFANILQSGEFYNTSKSPVKGYRLNSDIERLKYILQPANNPGVAPTHLADVFVQYLKIMEEQNSNEQGENGQAGTDMTDDAVKNTVQNLSNMEMDFLEGSEYSKEQLIRQLIQNGDDFNEALERLLGLMSSVEGDMFDDGSSMEMSTTRALQSVVEVFKDPLLRVVPTLRTLRLIDPVFVTRRAKDPLSNKCLVLLIDCSYSMTQPSTKLLLLSYLFKWAKQLDIDCHYTGYREAYLTTPIVNLATSDPAKVLDFSTGNTQTIRVLSRLIREFPQQHPGFSSYVYVVFTDDQDYQIYTKVHEDTVAEFVSAGGKFHVFKCEEKRSKGSSQNIREFCEKYGGTYVEAFV